MPTALVHAVDKLSSGMQALKVNPPYMAAQRKRKLPTNYAAAASCPVHYKPGFRGVPPKTNKCNPCLEVLDLETACFTLDAELYNCQTILPEAQVGTWKKVIKVQQIETL
jgi:hypothetical protein